MLTQFNLNLVELALLALASWRLTHFIVEERGPFAIMEWTRVNIFRFKYNADLMEHAMPLWSEVFNCVWCLSLYMGILFLILRLVILSIMNFVILSLAISAIIVFLEKYSQHRLG